MVELQLLVVIAIYIFGYIFVIHPMIEEERANAVGTPRIIGFAGLAGSGKTTCAEILCRYANYQDRPMAGPLKAALGKLFGFSYRQMHGNKKEIIDEYWGKSPREIMQFIGTDIFRGPVSEYLDVGDAFWIRAHARSLQREPAPPGTRGYVISDIRFQNEIDYIHRLGGIVIMVRRGPREDIGSRIYSHISEQPDKLQGVDIVIENNGTIDELRNELMRAIKL